MARSNIDRVVLGTLNASVRVPIDVATLLDCFEDASVLTAHRYAMATLFTECKLATLDSFIAAHCLAADVVLEAYRQTRELTGDENRALEVWLGEMAHAASLGARVP